MSLAVIGHLHFWQNDRDLLRAAAVTRNRNRNQHRKLTLDKKIIRFSCRSCEGSNPRPFDHESRAITELSPFSVWVFPSVELVDISLSLLKCCFTSTETVGLLGTGAQDVHLDFHTAPEL